MFKESGYQEVIWLKVSMLTYDRYKANNLYKLILKHNFISKFSDLTPLKV